ncbi:hypothetical protein KAFR_0F01330 [Kazachstania africana CBS 2517]|uniref:Cleavage/polyadenylation specificity factor A subunit N-terminal domain-containing protein n=1 Tax=Kazachstania africana (strain ATCC 22294 / BCRC 22015 / CBS 2517 / CECT 1963 / NBRC 1671 / NRRL Y-8276) TaxID=1071382 RepID=H2AWH9_KAZAF|nr:hypothetical protein KAFR_0F01330 [Kazachstania africana CBS 2517]CCF58729.1 hypothetical protein KAFR_0F01330 [Kazachstania africana CBS 2517]
MSDKLILNSLKDASCVVASFNVESILFLVKTESIERFEISKGYNLNFLNNVRTLGYTVAAALYIEPLSTKEYFILLKDNGCLEILNSETSVVDRLETGFKIDRLHNVLFRFDEKYKRLYINLTRNALFSVQFQTSKSYFKFSTASQNPICVRQFSYDIISLDLCSNFDVYTNEEMETLSIVLKEPDKQQYFFSLLSYKREYGKRKVQWEALVPLIELESISNINMHENSIASKLIPNIGTVIFSPSKTLFFSMPSGFESFIEGESVVNPHVTRGWMSASHNLSTGVSIQPLVIFEESFNSFVFKVIANNGTAIEIILDKLEEDEENYSIKFRKFRYRESSLIKDFLFDKEITLYMPLVHNTMFLALISDKLIFASLNHSRFYDEIMFEKNTYIYSNLIGYSAQRYISSGMSKDGKYFLEQDHVDCKSICDIEVLSKAEGEVTDVWLTKKHTWWRGPDIGLFNDCKYIDNGKDVKFIDISNRRIIDSNIESVTTILNDSVGNYCWITKQGEIKWSNSNDIYTVRSSKNHTYNLTLITSLLLKNGNNLTAFIIDSKLLVLKDHSKLLLERNFGDDFETPSSIFIHSTNEHCHILLGDIYGTLYILDCPQGKLISTFKCNAKVTKIAPIPNTDGLLIYSTDSFIIVKPSTAETYKLFRVDIPLKLKTITFGNSVDYLVMVDTDNCIYKLTLHENIDIILSHVSRTNTDVLINKIVEMASSSRYVICTFVSLEDNNKGDNKGDNKDVRDSGICLYNLHKKYVDKFTISEEYPQATVNDMVTIPFRPQKYFSYLEEHQMSFAKRLAYSSCFLVSLDFETAENENFDNLLLFTIDDDKGTIDFQSGIHTGYSITSIRNYYDNLFIVTGECFQVFCLEYIAKENKFRMSAVSNSLLENGFITDFINLPMAQENTSRRKKLRSTTLHRERILAADLLKGLVDCQLEVSKCSPNNDFEFPYKIRLDSVIGSKKHAVALDASSEFVISLFSVFTNARLTSFALCLGENKLRFYSTCNGEDFSMVEFYLPFPITSIVSVQTGIGEGIFPKKNVFEGSYNDVMFLVTTTNGGIYSISEASIELSKQSIDEAIIRDHGMQLNLIGAKDEDESDFEDEEDNLLLDNRILNIRCLKASSR